VVTLICQEKILVSFDGAFAADEQSILG